MKIAATLFVLGTLGLSPIAAQAQLLDDFNRGDQPTLGSGWTQREGTSSVAANQATGSNLSLATFNGGTGSVVSFDLFGSGTALQYGAAVLGYGGTSNNIFVKVQNQSGTSSFDTFGFYFGNNSSVGGLFGDLDAGFESARVTVSLTGTIATLFIDPNVGAAQSYSFDYGFTPDGDGIGLGFLGPARIDNFSGRTASVPEPATASLLLLALGGMVTAARRRTATRS